jgi:hypothetical protein
MKSFTEATLEETVFWKGMNLADLEVAKSMRAKELYKEEKEARTILFDGPTLEAGSYDFKASLVNENDDDDHASAYMKEVSKYNPGADWKPQQLQ